MKIILLFIAVKAAGFYFACVFMFLILHSLCSVDTRSIALPYRYLPMVINPINTTWFNKFNSSWIRFGYSWLLKPVKILPSFSVIRLSMLIWIMNVISFQICDIFLHFTKKVFNILNFFTVWTKIRFFYFHFF